jgi:hypothetical protein
MERYARTRLPVPASGGHVIVLQAGRLDSVDERAPETHLADDLVERALPHEEFLRRIRCKWQASVNPRHSFYRGGGRR